MRRRTWGIEWVRVGMGCVIMLATVVGIPLRLEAQESTLQAQIVSDVLAEGYWDDSKTLSASKMSSVIEQWGDEFAFALTGRELAVADSGALNPAALLAQSTLDSLVEQGGPRTLLMVTGDHLGGASVDLPYVHVMAAIDNFDRSDPEASFGLAAETLINLGTTLPEAVATPVATEVTSSSFFTASRVLVLMAIIAGILFLASVRSARTKRARELYTADAKGDTRAQIQAMSDLILELDPRITIHDDPELKKRYVEASDTYREVLEQADRAVTGHEVADLRIQIAKARWKLDVIDAELEGNPSPAEPHSRDTSGSAWDSTRGSGG